MPFDYTSDFLTVASNGPISMTSALRIESGTIPVAVILCRLIRDIPMQPDCILERGMAAIGRMNSGAMRSAHSWDETARESHTRDLINVLDVVGGTESPRFEFVHDAPGDLFDEEARASAELIFGVRGQVFGIKFEFGNLLGDDLKAAIRDYEGIYSSRIQELGSKPYCE